MPCDILCGDFTLFPALLYLVRLFDPVYRLLALVLVPAGEAPAR